MKGKPINIVIIFVYALAEKETDNFYSSLDNAKVQCKSKEITIIIGNLNAKVGKEQEGELVGKFRLWTQNMHGKDGSSGAKQTII